MENKAFQEAYGDNVVYQVSIGYYCKELVVLEEDTTDYGMIVDMIIDRLEERGETGYVKPLGECTEEELEFDDTYVIGGNHGLVLLHDGILNIERIW